MPTIQILEFQGRPACGGIAVEDGVMLMPGETIEVPDGHPLLLDKKIEIVQQDQPELPLDPEIPDDSDMDPDGDL